MTDLLFRDWFILNEIGHVALAGQQSLPLPGPRGEMMWYPVHMCDPMFETYHPVGHRENERGEIEEYTWQDMVGLNGIGWEGKLPFTRNLFFGCAAREKYAVVGPPRNLIRVPDDWFAHALFIDSRGNTSYYAPDGIYRHARAV